MGNFRVLIRSLKHMQCVLQVTFHNFFSPQWSVNIMRKQGSWVLVLAVPLPSKRAQQST